MKKLLFVLITLLSVQQLFAQDTQRIKAKSVIPEKKLEITFNKTTVLIFPSAIKEADRGDSYVLAEWVEGVGNVLKVKAGERNFAPSNLHVITADGKVYSFEVHYSDSPAVFTYDLGNPFQYSPALFKGEPLNNRELELYAATIKGIPPFISGVHTSKYGVSLRLDGIFIKEHVLFLRYKLYNNSQINFEPEMLRFYIRDKKHGKRTAVQDTSLEPIYAQYSGTPEQPGGMTAVIAFHKFTIAHKKNLVTQMLEKSGDRNLETKIDQRKLLHAKTLE